MRSSAAARRVPESRGAVTRRPDALRSEARLTLERFPQMAAHAHSQLGDVLWREGKHEEALAEYRLAMGPDTFQAFEAGFRRGGRAECSWRVPRGC